MPGLEINADQVKCSHGSTSSPITEEELFYLKARGISDKIARQLVTFGFVNQAIARLEHAELEGSSKARSSGASTVSSASCAPRRPGAFRRRSYAILSITIPARLSTRKKPHMSVTVVKDRPGRRALDRL